MIAAAEVAGVLGDEADGRRVLRRRDGRRARAALAGALTAARDGLGCTYFDWLSAVDELDAGYSVVAHLWSVERGAGILVRTHVERAAATLPTATGVFAGAAWHERETHEMFGIGFADHPHLVPLLLPDGFEGHPLRKEFVLASRAAKPWPGAKEPGESDADLAGAGHGASRGGAPGRRKTLPPGVPDPATWGPRPRETASAEPALPVSEERTPAAGNELP
jgi:NADH-quinone oxidoreductase subunit C